MFAEAPAAAVPPPAPAAGQGQPKQVVPSYAQVRAGGMLSLDAEMAGLIEAADMPAGEDKTHGMKADAVLTLQGGSLGVQANLAAALPSLLRLCFCFASPEPCTAL